MTSRPTKALPPAEIAQNREAIASLRAWISEHAHNQRFIAEALGVSDATVSKWLSGRQSMTMRQFMAVCAAIGAKPEEVLGGKAQQERLARYRPLAEAVGEMDDQELEALVAVASAMQKARRK